MGRWNEEDEGEEMYWEMTTFTDNDFSRCADIMRDVVAPEVAAGWIWSLKRGNWDALFAVLLCQTPCVSEIKIYGYGQSKTTYTDILFALAARLQTKAAPTGHPLSSLSSVAIHHWKTQCGLSVNSFHAFLALNSMEKIFMDRIRIDTSDIKVDANNEYLIKDMDLGFWPIDPGHLVEFLQCFKQLERLKYAHCGMFGGGEDFFPEVWGRGIAHLTDTLQVLDIEGFSIMNLAHKTYAMGSLSKFKSLREIYIDCTSLLGDGNPNFEPDYQKRLVGILPKSLEKLELSLCDGNFAQIVELIAHKEESVPALKKIQVYALPKARGRRFPTSLINDGEKKGVKLTIYGFEEQEEGSEETGEGDNDGTEN